MKILLLSFSGTGNTNLCASFLSESFLSKGHEVKQLSYTHEREIPPDIPSYDLIGIGYPIHAFNVPKTFFRFLKKLPPVKKKKFFIFKVSGEPFAVNNASSAKLVSILSKKGYELVGEKHFLMPYNIIFRYKDSIAKQMRLYLPALCEAYVRELLEGNAEKIRYRFYQRIISFLFRIEYIAPNINGPLVHQRKNCTHCLACLKSCPMGAIYQNKKGKIRVHGSKCVLCMRCTYNCPENALSFGLFVPWQVNGPYRYRALLEDKTVEPEYIHHQTKGYFRNFNKYFDRQKALLERLGIENPIAAYRAK